MKLEKLINNLPVKNIIGDADHEVTGVQADSRKVASGNLFVAVKGETVDGHQFIQNAIEQGANTVVCEHLPEGITEQELTKNITFVVTENTPDALGKILDAWHDHPTRKLTLVGVTGTNGKTTIATLLYELFKALGYKTGLLSTVCNKVDNTTLPATHTTPDPVSLHQLIADMVEAGCGYAFMEVSSHAAEQQRISGLYFKGGIFTNLTRDHLDYHGTIENYLQAKKKFFDNLTPDAFALVNADDKYANNMLQNTKAKHLTYALQTTADFKAKILVAHINGNELNVNGHEVQVPFAGKFNVYNLLAVYGAAVALGKNDEDILVKLSNLQPVPGRFETITSPKGYTAIVDYAHTPDALVNVLKAIREVLPHGKRVITVVGAGGNRDKGKRPLMAKAACDSSNWVILTSDNPRNESPYDIIADMFKGVKGRRLAYTLSNPDRRDAILTATTLATKGDVILVAGKGHEPYQEINGIKHPFDDRDVIRTIFANQI